MTVISRWLPSKDKFWHNTVWEYELKKRFLRNYKLDWSGTVHELSGSCELLGTLFNLPYSASILISLSIIWFDLTLWCQWLWMKMEFKFICFNPSNIDTVYQLFILILNCNVILMKYLLIITHLIVCMISYDIKT